MMIDLFSNYVRGAADTLVGSPPPAPGIGAFTTFLAAVSGGHATTEHGSDESVATSPAPETDVGMPKTQEPADSPVSDGAHSGAEKAVQTVTPGTTDAAKGAAPELDDAEGQWALTRSSDPHASRAAQVAENAVFPKAPPRGTTVPGAFREAELGPERRIATARAQTGTAGQVAAASEPEGRKLTENPAQRPLPPPGAVHKTMAAEVASSRPVAATPTANSAEPPTGITPAKPPLEQGAPPPFPARIAHMRTGNTGQEQRINAAWHLRDALATSDVQMQRPGARGPVLAMDAPVSPRPVSATALRETMETGAEWPKANRSPTGGATPGTQTGTLQIPPTAENAAGATRAVARSVVGDAPQLSSFGSLSPTASGVPGPSLRAAATPLQTVSFVTADAAATTAKPLANAIPQPTPAAPARATATPSRWVETPVTDSARWAPLPPGTGQAAPPPQFHFTGAMPNPLLPEGHRPHGGRLEAGEGRMLQANDGQPTTTTGATTFASLPDHTSAAPRPGVELAQNAARQIGAQVHNLGMGRFELSLSPNELGKVDMMLQDNDNRLTLIVNAERPETMDLIRRHIGLLELELRQMGLGNLSLQLGADGAPGSKGRQDREHPAAATGSDSAPEPVRPAATPLAAGDHLDLRL